MSISEKNKLIDVRDLAVYFHIEQGIVKSVDGVSFSIDRGKSLGLVGESGCGKTITALSLLLLHPFYIFKNLDTIKLLYSARFDE